MTKTKTTAAPKKRTARAKEPKAGASTEATNDDAPVMPVLTSPARLAEAEASTIDIRFSELGLSAPMLASLGVHRPHRAVTGAEYEQRRHLQGAQSRDVPWRPVELLQHLQLGADHGRELRRRPVLVHISLGEPPELSVHPVLDEGDDPPRHHVGEQVTGDRPQQGRECLPWWQDPKTHRTEEYETVHSLRRIERALQRDLCPHRLRDDRGARDLQRIEQREHRASEGVQRVRV